MKTATHRVFETSFPLEVQQAMRQEDSQAWKAITGILFLIVTGGALLGIAGVLLAL